MPLNDSYFDTLVIESDQESLDKVRVIAETNHEEALMNAPSKDSDYFRVPKVLKKSGG